MSYLFEFDAGNNILRCTWEGRITDETLFECHSAAERLLASRPPSRTIEDFCGVSRLDISSEAINRMANMQPLVGAKSMHVIVAPNDLVYGLSRMFSILGEQTRPHLYVVRTMEEAYGLLGVASPQFSRMSLA